MFAHLRRSWLFLVVLGSTCLCVTASKTRAEDVMTPDAADRLFTLKVLPLLKHKCVGCHGGDEDNLRGDYSVLTREHLIAGGESGEPAVVPGSPEKSPLYSAIQWQDSQMPPKENDRLTEDEIKVVSDWITTGARWPNESIQKTIRQQEWATRETEDGILVDTSGGLSDEWTYRRYQPEELWAFQPIQTVFPQLEGDSSDHPIDRFLKLGAKQAGISAAGRASLDVLIRRLTYDLTGLPPTPLQVTEFIDRSKVDAETAWTTLVDRLMATKQYGERQAQHWLDVVRYADTAGFSNDYERSNAWRYRDYVIRAFNADKPFNEFVIEQIAGDESQPDNPESYLATGMLRMGPWGTAMIPVEEARQIFLDDVVHNVGQSFLAMPLRCCKCHDHKFDPIPTRDYYAFYAAFAGTQPAERKADFLPSENRTGFEDKRKLVEELLDYAKAELKTVNDKQESAAKQWYAEHDLPYKNENARRKDPEDMKPPRHVGLSPAETGIKKVREQDVWIWERRLERYQPLAQTVFNGPIPKSLNGRKLRKPDAFDRTWTPETFILGGGALDAQLDAVSPGVLSAISFQRDTGALPNWRITNDLDGRRLELARWIAADKNPLTARVFVNRIWQSHFGKGLVATANNFGAKGSKPTHPELLDWLAADFIEHGWKVKRLHRLIVTSQAYQRSGVPVDQRQADVDPTNRLLTSFPQRRLSAEELRDSILLVTGELNKESGGVPIMPEINMEVALQPRMIQFSIAPALQPSRTPTERNRRTIYAYRVRGQAIPFLETMNRPNPNESCELRDAASVTPQAVTLLNSGFMTDRSIAFAQRIQREVPNTPTNMVRRAVRLAYGRLPGKDELNRLENYFGEMKTYHAQHSPEPVDYPREVVRSLVEEFTGEPFEFIEKLNVYEDYVPDAKPWTVDSETRALADVCLLLLNSNEFIYVY